MRHVKWVILALAPSFVTANPAPAPTDLKEKARQELTTKTSTAPSSTPTVMLPLHDPYQPPKYRSWLWSTDVGISMHRIQAQKPSEALGRDNLNELGVLPFLNLQFGFERETSWGGWGAALTGSTTMRNEDVQTETGLNLKSNIQYVSYGLEPTATYRFTPWLSGRAAIQYEQVTVVQSSAESDFARWSKSYRSVNPRLGADLHLTAKSLVNVSLIRRDIGDVQEMAWALRYGVRW